MRYKMVDVIYLKLKDIELSYVEDRLEIGFHHKKLGYLGKIKLDK
jgi:hypothetical protein